MSSRRLRRARPAIALFLFVAASWPAVAPAELTAAEKALAEGLFQDGRKLMDAGQLAEACPKFAESQRIDPSLGTLLNLAVCHERSGLTASAWAEFKEAAALATATGKQDRAELANRRAADLEAKLSRLSLEVASPAPGMVIKLNGQDLSVAAAVGSGIPVDPGESAVEATAPGKKPWSARVVIEPGPSTQRLTIPALPDAPRDEPPPPPLPPPPPPPPPVDGDSTLRTLGFVTGGVGLVGIGVGSVFGVMTFSKAGEVEDLCGTGCTKGAVALNDEASTTALVSTIAFGAGLAFLGAGATMVLLSGSSGEAKSGSQVWISPAAGWAGGQMTLGGRW